MRATRAGFTLLCAALFSVAGAQRAHAVTDSILVRVGGDITGRAGNYVDVPITVDLSGAPGRQLGSYHGQLAWNPALLELIQVQTGNFAAPQANMSTAGTGTAQVAAVMPTGATGVVTVFIAQFYILADTAQSPVTVSFDEMSATATSLVTPFEILLPLLKYVQGTFCRSLGQWGDVNHDGLVNSLDALVTLSVVVGLPVDTTVMTPALADVDGDGLITSRDALIMLSYAVGLPVTGTRVLLPAAGACGTGSAAALVIAPDSVELEVGQGVAVLAQATDAAGRAVPVDSLSWISSSPSIAGFDSSAGVVRGRSPGAATLTAQLGPGVQGTLKVSVIARRTTWYVDVQRALNVPAQVGSQALPFQFIGDAVGVALDGDTVQVASGTYEEIVSGSVSVVLLGDSVNRPVIDPRGSPSWSTYDDALSFGSAAAPLLMANLDVRAGGVYLAGHDITVRNVAIEGLGGTSTYAGLEVYSENLTPAPPARGGPARSGAPSALGNVLIDGVTVTADSTVNGIVVDAADTAIVQNSTVARSVPGPGGWSASVTTPSGIMITQASVSVVQNNVLVNPESQGIGAFDEPNSYVLSDVGRATISHNRVTGASSSGIVSGTRLVALDHNSVRSTAAGQSTCCYTASGIEATWVTTVPDTVTSLADTVIGVGGYYGYGLRVDTAVAALVDSLVVDSVGSAYTEGSGTSGLYFTGPRLTLTDSRISNSTGDGVDAYGGVVYTGRHNLVHNATNYGVYLGQVQCDGCSGAGPADSVLIAHDSVVATGSDALGIGGASFVQLDSMLVDSAGGAGMNFSYVTRGTVRNSAARHANTGISAYSVDTLGLLGDTTQADTYGVYIDYTVDSATIRGGLMDASSIGIDLDYSATARIDSVAVTNNGTAGLYIFDVSGARVRWSRFQANGIGMWMYDYAGMSSSVVNSNFLGNVSAGVENDAYNLSDGEVMLAADTNFWNDSAGPTCNSETTGFSCPGTTGDAIGSDGVTFSGFLTGLAPTAAPALRPLRALAAMPRRPASARQVVAAAPRGRVAVKRIQPVVAARLSPARAVAAPRGPRALAAPWHKPKGPQGIRVSRKR